MNDEMHTAHYAATHPDKKTVAYHEAAHVVIAEYLGLLDVESVSIKADQDTLGRIIRNMPKWFRPETERDNQTRDLVERLIKVALAGPMAVSKLMPGTKDDGGDRDREEAVCLGGMVCGSPRHLDAYVNYLQVCVEDLLDREPVWPAIESLAAELQKRTQMTKAEIVAFLEPIMPIRDCAVLAIDSEILDYGAESSHWESVARAAST